MSDDEEARTVEIPDEAEYVDVRAHLDGVYVTVSFYSETYKLLEEHTYDDGPEARGEEVEL